MKEKEKSAVPKHARTYSHFPLSASVPSLTFVPRRCDVFPFARNDVSHIAP